MGTIGKTTFASAFILVTIYSDLIGGMTRISQLLVFLPLSKDWSVKDDCFYVIFIFRLERIARRDKKAFLSNQSKEIEENNRMGKTRDLFKKIRDTKGTFHAKMGSIKDRNGMDLPNRSRRY